MKNLLVYVTTILIAAVCDSTALQPPPHVRLEGDRANGKIVVHWEKTSLTAAHQSPLHFDFQLQVSDNVGNHDAWVNLGPHHRGGLGGSSTTLSHTVTMDTGERYFRLLYGLDLSGQDLSGLDLSNVDFSHARLDGTDFSDADLSGSCFQGASLSNTVFTGADLGRAYFGRMSGVNLAFPALGGPPTRGAGDSIPGLPYAANPADAVDDGRGRWVSSTTLVVLPAADAETADVNLLLASHGGMIVGGIPGDSATGERGLLIVRFPAENLAAASMAFTTDPSIELATPESYLFPAGLPEPGSPPLADWSNWDPLGTDATATWGIRLCRIPQMWNFNEYLAERERKGGMPAKTDVGIVDGGYLPAHTDLVGAFSNLDGAGVLEHGTLIAGVIGALHNRAGLDGINPFSSMHGVGSNITAGDNLPDGGLATGEFYSDLILQLGSVPSIKVVNISMALHWRSTPPSPLDDPNASQPAFVVTDALIYSILINSRAAGPVIVKAAGNESLAAPWVDGVNHAALQFDQPHTLIVEAIQGDATGNESLVANWTPGAPGTNYGSNFGAQISAPGFDVFTTCTNDTYCPESGTSLATPVVSGVLSYLFSMEPSLTREQAMELVTTNASPVTGAAPRLDAFAAAMDIDRILGQPKFLKALLDVDDGSPDGNRRVTLLADPDPEADPTEPVEVDFVRSDLADLGDGEIDMGDFRRFRDWHLIALANAAADAGGTFEAVEGLDGPVDHLKNDPNRNQRSYDLDPDERYYIRTDFNGDGLSYDPSRSAGMRGHLAGQTLDDLEVFQSLFSDPDTYYAPADLPALMDSSDLHLSLYWFMAFNAQPGLPEEDRITQVQIRIDARFGRTSRVYVRDVPPGEPEREAHFLITLPVSDQYRVYVCGDTTLAEGVVGDDELLVFDDKPGRDYWFAPHVTPDATCGPGE